MNGAGVRALTLLRAVALIVVAFAASVPAAAAAGAGAPAAAAEAIAALNAQRARSGLPAGITENPAWSEGCRLHIAYRALNGPGANAHDEDPALPGYTVAGRDAARSSVLYAYGYGRRDAAGALINPWETAPLHLMQLLGPGLSVTGYHDGCMYTWPGYQRPAPAAPQLLSYPGEGVAVEPAMVALESPFVPGDFVGLPQPTLTGPHLYVLAFGASAGRLSDVSLTGPDGPVAVRHVDNFTTGPPGSLTGYLPPGGIIIPVAPLRELASYRARATFTPAGGGAALVRDWSFETGAAPPPPRMAFSATGFSFSTEVPGVLRVVNRDTGAVVIADDFPVAGSRSQSMTGGRYGATFRACFAVDAAKSQVPSPPCVEATFPGWETVPRTPVIFPPDGVLSPGSDPPPSPGGSMPVAPGRSRAPGVKLTVSRARGQVRAVISPGLAGGRSARFSVQRLRRACARCALKPFGKTRVRNVRLAAGSKQTVVSLGRAPARVRVSVAAFRRAGVAYRAADVTRTVR